MTKPLAIDAVENLAAAIYEYSAPNVVETYSAFGAKLRSFRSAQELVAYVLEQRGAQPTLRNLKNSLYLPPPSHEIALKPFPLPRLDKQRLRNAAPRHALSCNGPRHA